MMYMHHEEYPAIASTTDIADHSHVACVCTGLRKASRAVTRVYDALLAESGMTTTQLAILRTLNRTGGELPLSRLAERLVMDRTSLYRTIAPIERAGWVRVEDGEGRARIACITDTGREAMAGAGSAWADAQNMMDRRLNPGEWDQLIGLLGRLSAVSPP